MVMSCSTALRNEERQVVTVTPELKQLARDWLAAADRLGWGADGPEGAEVGRAALSSLLGTPDPVLLAKAASIAEERPLRARPVESLWSIAGLVAQAAAEPQEQRRTELVSAARGWLSLLARQ